MKRLYWLLLILFVLSGYAIWYNRLKIGMMFPSLYPKYFLIDDSFQIHRLSNMWMINENYLFSNTVNIHIQPDDATTHLTFFNDIGDYISVNIFKSARKDFLKQYAKYINKIKHIDSIITCNYYYKVDTKNNKKRFISELVVYPYSIEFDYSDRKNKQFINTQLKNICSSIQNNLKVQ